MPGWLAEIVQVPKAKRFTVLPDTAQTGVVIELNSEVTQICVTAAVATGVQLAGGRTITADRIVINAEITAIDSIAIDTPEDLLRIKTG